jgi:cysteinyl-tRNA synthetase
MLRIFNTLTRTREIFEPLGDVVGIYTCGPSVYQYAHIGNFRTFIFEDVLVRYLKFKGYIVKRVMNITDIEDKAIQTAREDGKTLREMTEYYSLTFFEDMETLNLLPADVFPKATDHVTEIIVIIKRLMENGFAYREKDCSVYYDISKFNGWGKLSRLNLRLGKKKIKRDEWCEGLLSDFAVWKSYDKEDGEVFWETELGKGRPGWHIECSAMCSKHLGTHFDIHMGGVDNIYPHHENVIAQNFGAFGQNPSKYWVHCRHLIVDGKKMSKSAGNFYTLRDLIGKGFEPKAIKYLLLSISYRRRLNFTFDGLRDAAKKMGRIQSIIERLKTANGKDDAEKMATRAMKKFVQAMDDNINTGNALKMMEEFTDEIERMNPSRKSSEKILDNFRNFDSILGLGFFKPA